MMYKIKLQECMISTNKYIYIYIYWHLVFKFRTVVYMRVSMCVCVGGAVSTQTTYYISLIIGNSITTRISFDIYIYIYICVCIYIYIYIHVYIYVMIVNRINFQQFIY